MNESGSVVMELLAAFRRGDHDVCDQLLRHYAPWLNLLARLQIETHFQGKFGASDIVQQTMLAAFRDFPQFQGTTEAELTAWLRQILAHTMAHEIRRYRGVAKRDINRERSIDQQLAQSSQRLRDVLIADETSPSQRAERNETEVLLSNILDRMPDDYRDVLVLRNLQGMSYKEISVRMERSVGAVRMLWARALGRLREEMKE